MTPRITTEPDRLPPGSEEFLASLAKLKTAPVRTQVRIHAYDCDFIRGTNTVTCTCGDAA